MPTKAFAYVRFSDPGAQADGDSIARQLSSAEAYAAEHGLVLDTSYRDEGVSSFKGANRKEGALGRFLSKVVTGEVPAGSYLLIEDFDRLSREPVATANATFTALVQAGIVIVTTMDGAIYSTATINHEWAKLVVGLSRMAAAHAESEKKSTRTLRNWKVRRAAGVIVDRLTKPAWLDVIDGAYEVNADRKRVLIRIFGEIAAGVGADSVARRLNEDGEAAWGCDYKKTGPRAGKTKIWHGSYIQNLINGRQVIGEHQHHQYEGRKRVPVGDPIAGYFPVAVPLDLYHRAKSAFKSRSMGGGRKSTKLVNVFGDLAKCGQCGGRMRWNGAVSRARDGKSFVYLICSSNRQRSGCDHSERHRLEYTENAVLDLVTEIRLDGLSDDTEAKAVLAEALHQQQIAKDRARKAGRLIFEMDTPIMRELAMEAQEASLAADQSVIEAEEQLAHVLTWIAPSNQQKAIADLRAVMATDPDVTHRIRLQGAIRGVVDQVAFDRDGQVTVTLMGGKKVYRFAIAKKVTTFALVVDQTVIEGGFVDVGGENAFKALLAACPTMRR